MKETIKTTEETVKRKPRKKVYERAQESQIPKELVEHFKKDVYDLRLIKFLTEGEEDYRYLYNRENDGYEFVSISEIPEKLRPGMLVLDTKNHKGLVTVGDLCLMKIDSDLRKSRIEYIQKATDAQINSVDIHVLEKKGFINQGSSSRLLNRETSFQN